MKKCENKITFRLPERDKTAWATSCPPYGVTERQKNGLRLKSIFVWLYYFTIWIIVEWFFINVFLCRLQKSIQSKILFKKISLPFSVVKRLAFLIFLFIKMWHLISHKISTIQDAKLSLKYSLKMLFTLF